MNWNEVCEDKFLRDLPFKIELNTFGQVVMSPVKNKHGVLQVEIVLLLNSQKQEGKVIVEFSIQTSDNVKVADIIWISSNQYEKIKEEDVSSLSPELCIEVKSASNTWMEMEHKKRLYFEKGAKEFWICDSEKDGEMIFFNEQGPIRQSELFPQFPHNVER